MTESDKLDAIFSALANPTRRAILARLARGETTVGALAEPFDMSLPAISRHISVLENAELVTRGKEAQFRPCMLNVGTLRDVATWADQYRHIWEARFDALDQVITAIRDNSDG